MNSNKLFKRFPILFIILAVVLIANNLLHFAPAQVLKGNIAIIVPGVLLVLGAIGIVMKMKEKKQESNK